MDSDGYTATRMYLIALTEHSTDGKMVNFIFHTFYQNENESMIYSVRAHTHTHTHIPHPVPGACSPVLLPKPGFDESIPTSTRALLAPEAMSET